MPIAAAGPGLGPFADLHRHLDGSLRLSTLVELAGAAGVRVPEDIRFTPGMGLAAALERFRLTLSVLQGEAAVRRVAAEICDDAEREGVDRLEIRFGPQLHRGATMDRIVDAALDGVGGRAGILLCALYGDPPDLVEELVALAAARPGVVGIDLAGAPRPDHARGMADYRPAFARARRLGLGRTVHAGEGRPASEIRDAIELLGAQRIGHGTTLLEEPGLIELVLERGVVIEACLTSNLHTGAIASVAEHPLARWLAAGVRCCVNTDNTLLSGVDSPGEHDRAAALAGMSPELLDACVRTGHAAAFAIR